MTDPVYLNVGGVYFVTSRGTLAESDSYFSGLVRSGEAEYFVDRDPTYFRHVLNWLRGVRFLPEDDLALQELQWESDFYAMADMRAAILNTKMRFSLSRALHGIHQKLQ